MVWSDKHKIIFFHLPKTGGTSIEKALILTSKKDGYGINQKRKAMQHFDWKEYQSILGIKKYNQYYKFAVSRNPYQKVLSDYYWLKYVAKINNDNFQKKTFDEYLDYCEHIVKNKLYHLTIYHDHFKPQHEFLYDSENKLMINKILRFENFEYVKKFIKIRYKAKVEHTNNNKNKQKLELTTNQKNKIYKIYEKDFILLKYDR